MTREQFIKKIIEDPENPGELLLDLGEDLCAQMGWAEGDNITWTDNGDGTWLLEKRVDNDN
jgi:hypothetical protein